MVLLPYIGPRGTRAGSETSLARGNPKSGTSFCSEDEDDILLVYHVMGLRFIVQNTSQEEGL